MFYIYIPYGYLKTSTNFIEVKFNESN